MVIKPLTAVSLIIAFVTISGASFSVGRYLFPNSSPFLHREVIYQGNLTISEKGTILTLPNSEQYVLKPKSNTSFNNLQEGLVSVKGNLTTDKFVIDVSEIIPLSVPNSITTKEQSEVIEATEAPNIELPKLYSQVKWEITQKKTLVFTSGKRRINVEGIYLESEDLKDFPQDFINYYTQSLQSLGFKQTLDSTTPDGKTLSYEKDGLFLTFGTKNIYQGSGDKKQQVGYKVYIEHN